AAHARHLSASVAEGVTGAWRHHDCLARPGRAPAPAAQELGPTLHHGEALLHGGVEVRRDATAGVHPHLDVLHLAAAVVAAAEAVSRPEHRVLDQAVLRLAHPVKVAGSGPMRSPASRPSMACMASSSSLKSKIAK